jgi:hypothetical protein
MEVSECFGDLSRHFEGFTQMDPVDSFVRTMMLEGGRFSEWTK